MSNISFLSRCRRKSSDSSGAATLSGLGKSQARVEVMETNYYYSGGEGGEEYDESGTVVVDKNVYYNK